MNQTLEEMKKLAEEVGKDASEAWFLASDVELLAANCLRLIEALEKCREQRDDYINTQERPGGPNIGRYKSLADKQLEHILRGEK